MPGTSADSSQSLARGWLFSGSRDLSDRDPEVSSKRSTAARVTSRGETSKSAGLRAKSLDFSIHLEADSRRDGPAGALPETRSLGARVATEFPQVGELIGGFRLVGLLGRGSFAQVYLAEQVDLGERRVALKVSRAVGDEPRTLARLQHTHIVPIHSVYDDPVSGLRLLCMPYFGGANLADVLRSAGPNLPSLTTGRSLVEALDRLGGPAEDEAADRLGRRGNPSLRAAMAARAATRGLGSPASVRSLWARALAHLAVSAVPESSTIRGDETADPPGRLYLRSHSFVESAVWIAARLAEGLDHAHSRGLLHRDLKPSNILIAADGSPMLLDFNLSADLDRPAGGDEPLVIGGTLPYMAPEHLDAFNPLGMTPPEAVDERSDIYALGLILFEMVAGHHPFADPEPGARLTDVLRAMIRERRQGAPSARASNAEVSWGLDSILRKCLDPEPDRRYAAAGDLAEDLRRLLDDRPLKFAPERSTRERLEKWARRHPRASGVGTIAGFAAAALISVGGAAIRYRDGLESTSAQLRFNEFRAAFDRCQLLLNTTSGPGDQIGRGLALAETALRAYDVDRADVGWRPPPSFQRLSPSDRQTLREEISELLLLDARGRIALASRSHSESRRSRVLRDAVRRLDLAERIDPRPSAALFDDRARDLAALGEADRAASDRRRAESTPPASSRDHYLLGTAMLARGDRERAESLLSRAVALDARRFWAWFALGLCHLDQGRSADAAGDFAACTVIAPDFAWPHLNRGLALARSGRLIEARAAYDRALAVDPDFVEARLDRALTLLELGEPAGAFDDLDRAVALGRRDDPAVLAARAEALARLGRRNDAERDFGEVLRVRPHDPTTLVARGFSRIAVDPAGARGDFDHVLARNPGHGRAHLGLAMLFQRSDPKSALREADAALDALPEQPDALALRALLRARAGDPSAEADVALLLRSPTPHRLYNAACAYSLLAAATHDDRYAIRGRQYLDGALKSGFDRAYADRDADLAAIRR